MDECGCDEDDGMDWWDELMRCEQPFKCSDDDVE